MSKSSRTAAARPEVTSLHYEPPAIQVGRTLFWVATVVVTVVLSAVAGREIYVGLVRPPRDRSTTPLYGQGLVLPAEPRLEGIEMMGAAQTVDPASDEARLQSYGWIDRDKKIVRIPIQEAMKLAIEQGWLRSTAPKPTDRSDSTDESRGAR